MLIKTKYRLKNSSGTYDEIYFQTSADLVITDDERQFVSAEEKDRLNNKLGTYTHVQGTPESTWEILHNLGRFPSVTIIDSANTMVIGDVEYVNENAIRVTFSSAFSGKAYLN